MTVLTKSNLRRNQLQGTVFPGITQLMPPSVGVSARIRGGMGFGLSGLSGLGEYAKDANGNIIYDQSGAPVQVDNWASLSDLITKGLALLNSQQVFQLNLQRAQNNLPPLNVAQPQVNLGVAGINASTLLLIAAGLAGILLLKRR